MITGYSLDFINSFMEYKNSKKLNYINLVFNGDNTSREFLNTSDIISEIKEGKNYYNRLIKYGGIYSIFKMYDPIEFYFKSRTLKNQFATTYNFSPHLEKALSNGVIEKKGNKIIAKDNFFSPVSDSLSNNIIFGSSARYGYLIDIDNTVRASRKTSYERKYEINENMNKMFIDVDAITLNQNERKIHGNDFGFLVINTPGYYFSPLGLFGINVSISRRDEIPSNIQVIE